MNILNRVKKAEAQIIGTKDFCRCAETPKFESVAYENGTPTPASEYQKHMLEPVPDNCSLCGKPIMKTTIIVDFIDEQKEAHL